MTRYSRARVAQPPRAEQQAAACDACDGSPRAFPISLCWCVVSRVPVPISHTTPYVASTTGRRHPPPLAPPPPPCEPPRHLTCPGGCRSMAAEGRKGRPRRTSQFHEQRRGQEGALWHWFAA